MDTPEPQDRLQLPTDPSRWTTGDWSFEDKWDEDEDWARPEPPDTPEEKKRLHRRIGTEAELLAVADAIVHGYEITETDSRGQARVIVGKVGPDKDRGHGLTEQVVVENLLALIVAVQAHPAVRLARVEVEQEADGDARVVRRRVTDRDGAELPGQGVCTTLRLEHSIVARTLDEGEEYRGFHIGVTLRATARFHAVAWFHDARFHADAGFANARFHTDAWFAGARFHASVLFDQARFHAGALFDLARFHAGARFGRARFHADARFDQARFHAGAWFGDACFHAFALFFDARFYADAGFVNARFHTHAWFAGACFHADTEFIDARFHAGARFGGALRHGDTRSRDARFHGDTWFSGASFQVGEPLTGDFRRIDMRATRVERLPPGRPDTSPWPHLRRSGGRVVSWGRASFDAVGWTLLRAIGELSFLARLSVFALLLVPPLASSWPAIRAGIVGYNEAVSDASARFHEAAEALDAAAAHLPADPEGRIEEAARGVESSIETWSARFARMTVDEQDLPASLALAFFAAGLITLGQLVYQVRAPSTVRKRDEDEFIEWMHDRYGDDKPDRDDGLRRACEWLAAAAKVDPRRCHANLVSHHGETVWVPSKEHLGWFEDIEPEQADAADTPEVQPVAPAPIPAAPQHPEGYLPATVRRRIAIEEGARVEYWMTSRRHRVAAWSCLLLYAAGMAALLGILYVQGLQVARAAGWLPRPGEVTPAPAIEPATSGRSSPSTSH